MWSTLAHGHLAMEKSTISVKRFKFGSHNSWTETIESLDSSMKHIARKSNESEIGKI